jgi:AbrB family looped-hinge helix DNA binding protein
MDIVTISPKFQVVIPRAVRERLKLEPGQKVQAIVYDDRVEFIPLRASTPRCPVRVVVGQIVSEERPAAAGAVAW